MASQALAVQQARLVGSSPRRSVAVHRPCGRRLAAPRLRAQQEQQQQHVAAADSRDQQEAQRQQGAATEEEEQEQDVPDIQPPKFLPFSARNSQHATMTAFTSLHDCSSECRRPPGYSLLVLPLSAEWVNATADLLTDTFAEAMNAQLYKNSLRRRVRQYLEAHMNLPPKAVVLLALLQPPVQQKEQAEQEQQKQRAGAEAAGVTATTITTSNGAGDAASSPLPDNPDGLEVGDGMGIYPVLGSLGSLGGNSSGSGSSSSRSSSGSSSSSSSEDEAVAAAAGSEAVLVGVVELSFSASTRSKYLTLTPPEDQPYLCNMAIHPDHRGRGYGSALLRAAEALVAELGETEVYLHLRVQDMPAARLYSAAGYEEVASDSFLIRLLAIDQRRLLRKRLPQPPPPPEPERVQQVMEF